MENVHNYRVCTYSGAVYMPTGGSSVATEWGS